MKHWNNLVLRPWDSIGDKILNKTCLPELICIPSRILHYSNEVNIDIYSQLKHKISKRYTKRPLTESWCGKRVLNGQLFLI